MIQLRTNNALETQAVAAALAESMRPRDLVLLVGEMGAGKTTFTQGFGHALGVTEHITSPTFVLMRSYDARLPLHHVDVYRLTQLQEVIDLGLVELLDEGGVALVEWGDVARPVLPRDFLEVRMAVDEIDDDVRNIVLEGSGSWTTRETSLAPLVEEWRYNSKTEGQQ